MVLTENELFQLKKMVESNNTTDQTNEIRSLKHSPEIKKAVHGLMQLKAAKRELLQSDKKAFEVEALEVAGFLFYNYFELYNQLIANDIDEGIMNQFLDILAQIEEGVVDQHEGSYMVGKILKEIYIDSKVKEMERLDKLSETEKMSKKTGKLLSWKQYKLEMR